MVWVGCAHYTLKAWILHKLCCKGSACALCNRCPCSFRGFPYPLEPIHWLPKCCHCLLAYLPLCRSSRFSRRVDFLCTMVSLCSVHCSALRISCVAFIRDARTIPNSQVLLVTAYQHLTSHSHIKLLVFSPPEN